MENKVCLNCSEEVSRHYCANCGQKAETHRITLPHFLMHDLLHGVWHLDRGILFTLKETIVRPGQAALDYISGKRIRYYNVFYLSILLIALNVILVHFYDGIIDKHSPKKVEETSEFVKFLSENLKFVLLSIVPIIALNGWLVFRRLKLNIAEHIIIGGISLVGILIFSIPLCFVKFIEEYRSVEVGILKLFFIALMMLFPVYAYSNAAKRKYSIAERSWRLLLFHLLMTIQILLVIIILVFAVTSQSGLDVNF